MNKKGKSINKKISKLLYRSFDHDLSEKERRLLADALKNSEELRREKEQILAQRKAVGESAVKSFTPYFADRVMERIQSEQKGDNTLEAFYETLKVVFRGLAIAGAVVMIVLLSYNLFKVDSVSMGEIYYTADMTAEEILQLPLF